MFYLQLLLILLAATALLCWSGWGAARLALPQTLQPYRVALTPLVGFAVLLVLGYWAVWTVFGLWLALPLIVLLMGCLNLLAWRRTGSPQLPSAADLRAELPLLALLLLTLLLSLAPLLHYGHTAVIGGGWDIETALPTARYLERGPVRAIADQPTNPLRDLVRDPPRIGKTLGFAVFQGSVDLLTRNEAIETFTPLLALLRTLGVLAVYLLYRATLGLRRWPALLGAAFTSAGALMLWTTFFNFEKQLAGWPLIPLGLLVCVAAAEQLAGTQANDARRWRNWPVALLAAVVVAAQCVAYYPALTLWVPLALALGVALLAQSHRRAQLLGAAVAIGLLTLLVAAPTLVDYQQGFLYRYSQQLTTLGIFYYIPFSDVVGLTPFAYGATETPATPLVAWVGTVLLVALLLVGCLLGQNRWRWLALLAGGLVYMAWLRWSQAYPYAYMKGLAYAGFVFVGAAAAGWQVLSDRLPRPARWAALSGPLLLLGLMGAAQGRILADHWQRPGLYAEELPDLVALRGLVPAGSTVTLSSDPRLEGVRSGLAAYLLDHTTVWGQVRTGYGSSKHGGPDALGEYGLLHRLEDPQLRGYDQLLWRGGSFALYRRTPGTLAHLLPERLLQPGDRVTLSAGDNQLTLQTATLVGGQQRRLELGVVTLEAGQITLDGTQYAVPAGSSLLRVPPFITPHALELHNTGATPLLLRSLTLGEAGSSSSASITPLQPALVARAAARAEGQQVNTTFEALLPNSGPVVLSLDVWDAPNGVHYGWYGLELRPGSGVQTITTSLDLATGTMRAVAADGAELPIGAQFEGLRTGSYVAQFQAGAGRLALTAPVGLFWFEVAADGTISGVRVGDPALLATRTNRPPHMLAVRVGEDTLLTGYDLPISAQPGAVVDLTLWWQARTASGDERSVLVQLVDASGTKVAQADGPPASGARPTAVWQAGELILDWRRIQLPADLPAGDYTLLVGIYRWPSLERLALFNGEQRQREDVVRLPLRVER